tara:strand:- start:355 stop:1020 length:666 start_codon:yes stop_codon:yes gene_type:complete
MNDQSVNKLKVIKDSIENFTSESKPNIICVSKTFPLLALEALIKSGHYHYGENKVQEAEDKWSEKLKIEPNLKIHMVGKLQSNKAKKAVKIFDFIHSLDNQKLADICKKSENDFNRKISYFIQVNIGNEMQKSGVQLKDVKSFLKYCKDEIKLNVIGLMVLPPNDDNTEKHFSNVSQLNYELGLKDLSMGMSADYQTAIKYKSTFLRIGSAILGPRSFKKY